jgi:hypothetical protein
MKSFRAISLVGMELQSDVSETVSASIISEDVIYPDEGRDYFRNVGL